jgi:serine/threonine protein kinase
MYYFLYGANPYSNMNVMLAYKTLARDGVVFPAADERNESGEVYDEYSADVKDLISKMLVVAPDHRISVADALNHPWIQSPPNKFLQHLHAELSEKYSKFRLPAAGPFLEFGENVLDD